MYLYNTKRKEQQLKTENYESNSHFNRKIRHT
nr:MAG TPA: hypothetical protein [Caudoviricetes sp.]